NLWCERVWPYFETLTGIPTSRCEVAVTPTDTPAATATQTGTPTGTAAGSIGECMCDCDGDGEVSINDLLRAVLVALGSDVSRCAAMEEHGAITIQDLIRGVHNALEGCS